MDGAAFQGMRFPLTAAEEALLPRPHASASQVATALPATYSRHHQHRPQYSHKHLPSTNHPYQSTAASPSRFFSFSSSSVLATRSQRPSSPPLSPSASPNPQTTFDPDDVEYPQNPKHSYQYPHQSPVSPTSYYSPPRRSFSQSPRPAGLSSPNLYSEGYESIQTHEGHQDPWIGSTRIESPVPLSDSEESSRSGTKKELPEADRQPPRRSGSKGFLGRFRESISSPNIVQHAQPSNVTTASGGPGDTEDDDSISLPQYQQRTSLESDVAPRKISFESHAELSKMSRTSPQEISDDELHSSQGQQEHASATHSKRRPSWRPSLSLIRQEGSSFNVLTPLQDQRRYPQNDRRRLTDAHAPDHDHDERHAGRKGNPGHRGKKRRRGSPRHGQTSDLEAQFQPPKANSRVLPSLADVLEKRTRYPLSYEDFEAFLRHYRAVEYLNFWADVTAHEQLCRTFEISERRLKREQQLEERALDRRRRGPRPSLDAADAHIIYAHRKFSNGFAESSRNASQPQQQQGLSSSNLYMSSRSSLQLPIHDHLSFPPETRRYGVQDQSSFPQVPPSMLQRGTGQRGAMGSYNRQLAGSREFYRPSFEDNRPSIDETVILEDDSNTTPPSTESNTRRLVPLKSSRSRAFSSPPGADASQPSSLALKPSRRRAQTGEGQVKGQSSQVQDEMAQLVEAVEVMIQNPPSAATREDLLEVAACSHPMESISRQSSRNFDPTLYRMPSTLSREDGRTSPHPLQPPLPLYRFGQDSHSDTSVYSTIQNGRTSLSADGAPLVQSYRTIGFEDVEESVLRIHRKYLVQLRTASMAREEHAAAATPNGSGKAPMADLGNAARVRTSGEDMLAPGLDGYAGQVIAEWNAKWSRRRAEGRRRSRRRSQRRNSMAKKRLSGVPSSKEPMSEKAVQDSAPDRTDDSAAASGEKPGLADGDDEGPDGQSSDPSTKRPKRPRAARTATSTGITAFITRLLRTETSVLELPTLTINMTTVIGDAASGSEDDYDEDEYDEYDSGDSDVDDNTCNGEEAENSNRHQLTKTPVAQVPDRDRESAATKDLVSSGTLVPGSGFIMNELEKHRPSLDGKHSPSPPSHSGAEEMATLQAGSISNPSDATKTQSSAAKETPRAAKRTTLSAVSHPATMASFYLPLECRQRIHTQIQQEGRTDGTHVFGPAKGFVVDVVLQEHYYPLFLRYAARQNMGQLHRNHANNRIKRRGATAMGISLWAVVIAIQVTLVLMDWGGWSRPWAWIVGLVGGFPGTVCLITGRNGFSPVLGLLGKIAEDKHVARFRRVIEPSIRFRHRSKAIWVLFLSLVLSTFVTVIFAALPQRQA